MIEPQSDRFQKVTPYFTSNLLYIGHTYLKKTVVCLCAVETDQNLVAIDNGQRASARMSQERMVAGPTIRTQAPSYVKMRNGDGLNSKSVGQG